MYSHPQSEITGFGYVVAKRMLVRHGLGGLGKAFWRQPWFAPVAKIAATAAAPFTYGASLAVIPGLAVGKSLLAKKPQSPATFGPDLPSGVTLPAQPTGFFTQIPAWGWWAGGTGAVLLTGIAVFALWPRRKRR